MKNYFMNKYNYFNNFYLFKFNFRCFLKKVIVKNKKKVLKI